MDTQWFSATKAGKAAWSLEQLMATVFQDSNRIIFIDYLAKKKTINDEYYDKLLQQFSDRIKEKRAHLTKKNVDKASAHKSAVAMVQIYKFRFELVPHSRPIPQ